MIERVPTVRSEIMKRFGFGPEVMKQQKVCRVCGSPCTVSETHCAECGAVLPKETLFDLYKSHHTYCPHCDTVVAKTAIFCPVCGDRLQGKSLFFFKRNQQHKKA